jgi:hypothetical protein
MFNENPVRLNSLALIAGLLLPSIAPTAFLVSILAFSGDSHCGQLRR